MIRKTILFPVLLVLVSGISVGQTYRRLTEARYIDKMKAGWVGQMAGVGWGAPTEFKWNGIIIPEDKMPAWGPGLINQFNQDDIYVEMTFLQTLEQYGLDVSIRQAGIDFANSGYRLWHANRAGRTNLRNGIAPPDSGHPQFNSHADDIDYQIEADFSGLIAPGMPNFVIELGEKFGRLMNYGDGLYGGQFVGGMYAEAFFEKDMERIVRAGLACIPEKSQYHECISDVLRWHKQNPDDWQKTWKLINEKYQKNPAYRRFSCQGAQSDFNIDAKINGAYIVMGLLYGGGDPDKTIIISTRCGQDSDCNPSNAGGILFTTIGFSNLPERFKSAIDPEGKFSHTPYTFPKLVDVSKQLVRQAVIRGGGRVETGPSDGEVFVIPVKEPGPSALEQCWEPGPIANSRFTEEEVAGMRFRPVDWKAAVEKLAPGWTVTNCFDDFLDDICLGYVDKVRGKSGVLVTHPKDRRTACILSRTVSIPEGKKTSLHLTVGHHEKGNWMLIVEADGSHLFKGIVGAENTTDGWRDIVVDLSKYAGKKIKLKLHQYPNDWNNEAGYWARIEIISK